MAQVTFKMATTVENTDPRVHKALRDAAGIDEPVPYCPFVEGDILDARSARWCYDSTQDELPAAAVVMEVDNDGTVEIGYYDCEGEFHQNYLYFEGAVLLNRL